MQLTTNQRRPITVSVLGVDGQPVTPLAPVEIVSSDPGVVEIVGAYAYGRSEGQATITATADGVSDSEVIDVADIVTSPVDRVELTIGPAENVPVDPPDPTPDPIPPPTDGGGNTYFDALVSRADHWKSYSLRDPAQLARPNDGGYAHANSRPLFVAYDADVDAAKVTIPAFYAGAGVTLAAPVSAAETTLTFTDALSSDRGHVIKIGDELLAQTGVVDRFTRQFERGALGSIAADHAAGATVWAGMNSLVNMIQLPLGTEDGHAYLVTWDGLWTDSYLPVRTALTNHKAFQFSDDGNGLWLETQTRFDGGRTKVPGFDPTQHVASIEARAYADLGPGTTLGEPIEPKSGTFILKPNLWTRFWWLLEQRANDFDAVSLWVADEQTDPVQIYDQRLLVVKNSISKFWLEFNTSNSRVVPDRDDLVAYVRNVVALVDPSGMPGLLVKPGG